MSAVSVQRLMHTAWLRVNNFKLSSRGRAKVFKLSVTLETLHVEEYLGVGGVRM